jgi:hypothetical protein
MCARLLQVNFTFHTSKAVYEQIVAPLASAVAAVPGLRWKIWLMNDAEGEAGGIYLFEDQAALQAFLGGPLVAQVTHHPALSAFTMKHFEVMAAVTTLTRGPVHELAST